MKRTNVLMSTNIHSHTHTQKTTRKSIIKKMFIEFYQILTNTPSKFMLILSGCKKKRHHKYMYK